MQRPREALRPTRAEIDLEAVAHNLDVLRAHAPASRVLAVVKADAYGHGVVPVARRLREAGVHGFGVALAEEGLELRAAGVEGQVLVLNGVYGDAHREVLAAGLTPVVYDPQTLSAFARAAGGAPFRFHLKVDTGMARLGAPLAELAGFLGAVAETEGAVVDGGHDAPRGGRSGRGIHRGAAPPLRGGPRRDPRRRSPPSLRARRQQRRDLRPPGHPL